MSASGEAGSSGGGDSSCATSGCARMYMSQSRRSLCRRLHQLAPITCLARFSDALQTVHRGSRSVLAESIMEPPTILSHH